MSYEVPANLLGRASAKFSLSATSYEVPAILMGKGDQLTAVSYELKFLATL